MNCATHWATTLNTRLHETVPTRGYRFLPLVHDESSAHTEPSELKPAKGPQELRVGVLHS